MMLEHGTPKKEGGFQGRENCLEALRKLDHPLLVRRSGKYAVPVALFCASVLIAENGSKSRNRTAHIASLGLGNLLHPLRKSLTR